MRADKNRKAALSIRRRLVVVRGLCDFVRRQIALLGFRGIREPGLGDLVDMRGKRRHPGDQRVEVLGIERQQSGLAGGHHGAAAFGSVQQRDFTEEGAVREPDALARQFDLDFACGDEIHRRGGVAAPHQNFA